MREKFEAIKNSCPWAKIKEAAGTHILNECTAISPGRDNQCYYKNCAVVFWLRHITPNEPDGDNNGG